MDKVIYYDVTIDENIVSRPKHDEIDPAILEEIKSTLNELSSKVVALDTLSKSTANSEAGAYGLRYYNGKLQVKSNNSWVDVPLDDFLLSKYQFYRRE